MSHWIICVALAFVLSALIAGIIIPQILLIAFRRRLFDNPNKRKIHTSSVPRLGGLAFMPTVFFTMSLLVGLEMAYNHDAVWPMLHDLTQPLAFGFCSLLMIYMLGMADDLVGVRYRAKFAVQIMCGALIISGGIWFGNMHGMLGLGALPEWAGWPLTVFVAVFLINAINLIDGIDGLASGLTSVTLLIYTFVFFIEGDYVYSAVSCATLGVLVPFFYYNVFGNADNKRKIFMGDTGSMTIGLMVSILSLHLLETPPPADCCLSGANMFVVAYAPLIIPCFDVVRVYLRRLKKGRNPFLPDKSHIHHILLALGWNQRRALCAIILASLLFTSANILLSFHIDPNLLLALDTVVWIAAMLFLFSRLTKKGIVIE